MGIKHLRLLFFQYSKFNIISIFKKFLHTEEGITGAFGYGHVAEAVAPRKRHYLGSHTIDRLYAWKQNLASPWALHSEIKGHHVMEPKKKKFKWSAQANETLNKCTCIFTADNSSGISCCCGYRGRKGSKTLVRQGGIRVSREISKRYCVSFHALEGQLQN